MIFKNLQKKFSSFRNLPPKTRRLKHSYGFTLVEMLTVISVIGILYMIVFGSVSDSKARGRDAKRIADIGVIQLALERYYDEFKEYPADLDTLVVLDSSVPIKDSQNNFYVYDCLNSCQSYTLNATLELYNNVLVDDADTDTATSEREYDVIPKF